MGKRSGVPHRDDEVEALGPEELAAEIHRCRVRLRIAVGGRQRKAWAKRLHWLESVARRRGDTG